MRLKESENRDVLLKGPHAHSLADTHLGRQWRVSSSGSARDIQRKTELRDARMRAGRTAAIAPLSAHFWCNPQTGAILPVWTPPALPILNLHWPVRSACPTPCLPGTLLLPIHKLPAAGPLPGSQPALCLPWAPAFMGKQQLSACAACTFQRRLLVVGHWCSPRYSASWADRKALWARGRQQLASP